MTKKTWITPLRTVAVVAVATSLVGCATTVEQCDPSDRNAGFFTKMSCDMSGAYREGIDQQEQRYLSASETNLLLKQTYADIAAQEQASNASVAVQRERQDKLARSVAQLTRNVQAKNSQQRQIQQRIASLQAQLEATPPVQSNSSANEIAEREAVMQQLKDEVRKLESALGF